MPPSSRIPPLLQTHIRLPRDESVVLLTSTLGATANWLIVRFLSDALSTSQDIGEEGHSIVLVSCIREYEFWKQEARKGVGLDLDRLRRESRFAFVDGLSELCIGRTGTRNTSLDGTTSYSSSESVGIPSMHPERVLQSSLVSGRTVPARGQPVSAAPAPAIASANSLGTGTKLPGHQVVKSLDVSLIKNTISSAVSSLTSSNTTPTTSLQSRRTLIILDNPDLLLALDPTIHAYDLTSLISTLHTFQNVSHILVHIQADDPLLSPSVPPQPLEVSHHNFVVKLAHMSRRILGVRVLDTGVARDVSGVVRITEQSMGWLDLGLDGDEDKNEGAGEGKEFLYQVKGDGSVRVFERGAGGEG